MSSDGLHQYLHSEWSSSILESKGLYIKTFTQDNHDGPDGQFLTLRLMKNH